MSPDARARAKAAFHVLIKPSGPACNLGCEYCFYLAKEDLFPGTQPRRMTAEVLEAVTRHYIEAQPAGVSAIDFTWQGGEPTLLGIPFFRTALELQGRFARAGTRITNSIQTNGILLDDEWGSFLRQNAFLVGISIDGPRELHDSYRTDRAGQPSFDRVLRGLDVLKRHEVEFNTLTVVHDRNGHRPRKVYDFLEEIGSRHLQFIPLVEPRARGVSDRSVGPSTYGRFLTGVFDRWLERRDVGRVFVRDFDVFLGLVMGSPSEVCIHAETCGRAVVAEHGGEVFACDHFVDPEHHLGNVLDDSLAGMLDGAQQTAFGRAKSAALPTCCEECEYLRLCNGGCPKDRLVTPPGAEPGPSHLCLGYKLFFQHSLPVLRRMASCLSAGRPAAHWDRVEGHEAGAAVGRNDPCPCGSGRKHKRCCWPRRGSRP